MAGMPWQLQTAKRRNPKARGYAPRPLVELLPAINVNDLNFPKTLKHSRHNAMGVIAVSRHLRRKA